jgi:5-formyltetrahydrofolate cyclo-ligase
MDVKTAKNALRNVFRALKLSPKAIEAQSANVASQLAALDVYKRSKRVGVYLSMPHEVNLWIVVSGASSVRPVNER